MRDESTATNRRATGARRFQSEFFNDDRSSAGVSRLGQGMHQGFPPATAPVRPVRAAPACFGAAGLSAGEQFRMKSTVTLRKGPLLSRRRLPNDGVVSDYDAPADKLARGLAWFSIALGLTELVAARSLAERLGMRDKSSLIRAYGVREIGHGVGILSRDRLKERGMMVWTRVAGDVLDLLTLAPGLDHNNPKRDNVVKAMVAVLGVTALDVFCAARLSRVGTELRH